MIFVVCVYVYVGLCVCSCVPVCVGVFAHVVFMRVCDCARACVCLCMSIPWHACLCVWRSLLSAQSTPLIVFSGIIICIKLSDNDSEHAKCMCACGVLECACM